MAGLTDMEELLGRVSNPEINSYLREAFVCYGAGAYRACIVLTANALFEDLRQKTKAVASINADAKAISAEIEKLAGRFQLADVAALAPPGFRLEHAKMCGIDGKPALHLVYTDGRQEVSMFLRALSGSDKTLRTISLGSEHLAGFRTDRLEAVVVSSKTECLEFARFAARAL